MKNTGYWVIRTYVSGSVGEKIKYFVPGSKPKNKRKYKSDVRKQEQNFYSAEKNLARLINANFTTGDILLGLDYSDEGICYLEQVSGAGESGSEEESGEKMRSAVTHELRLALRRVARECKKREIEFKYIAITSDMDGETGERVRVHHHLVISREVAEIFREKWHWGGCFGEKLRKQEDYTDIAKYFIRQVRKVPDEKKYISSRNLERPKPKDRIAATDAEVRVPKGCRLLFRNEYNEHRPQYIRYYIPEKGENGV